LYKTIVLFIEALKTCVTC